MIPAWVCAFCNRPYPYCKPGKCKGFHRGGSK